MNQLGGSSKDDIGTHSTRKGAVSYVLSLLGGPNVIQVFLRCCWSLGNVQDRYIFLDSGGDQFVGRSAGGLPLSDSKFATLPPHFSPEDLDEIQKFGWEHVLPSFYNFHAKFQVVIQYLFASLVFHVDFLRANLSPEHPLFQTAAFTCGWVDKYKGRILLGEGRCPITGMEATGVPPSVKILTELKELREENQATRAEVLQTKMEIISRLDNVALSLPGAVAKEFAESFNVEGHTPLTVATVQQLIHNVRDELLEAFQQRVVQAPPDPLPTVASQSIPNSGRDYASFSWINPLDRDKKNLGQPKIHPVPEGFLLPRTSAADCWRFWHFGDKSRNIAPFRGITCRDLNVRAEWNQLSRIRYVMDSLLQVAIANNHIEIGVAVKSLSEPEAHAIFEKALQGLLRELKESTKTSVHSHGIPSIGTMYNLIKRREAAAKSDAHN